MIMKFYNPSLQEMSYPTPAPMVSEINSDDTEIQDQQSPTDDDANETDVETKNNDTGNKKGQLVVQNYKLARKHKLKQRFSLCGMSAKVCKQQGA